MWFSTKFVAILLYHLIKNRFLKVKYNETPDTYTIHYYVADICYWMHDLHH
jgi:hypothetical protein